MSSKLHKAHADAEELIESLGAHGKQSAVSVGWLRSEIRSEKRALQVNVFEESGKRRVGDWVDHDGIARMSGLLIILSFFHHLLLLLLMRLIDLEADMPGGSWLRCSPRRDENALHVPSRGWSWRIVLGESV